MTITSKDGYKYKRIGKSKKIFYTSKGLPYFKWNGTRYYLSEVMRLTYPIMYDDLDNHYTWYIGGYITISNVYSVLVELDEYGDYVVLWEQIK